LPAGTSLPRGHPCTLHIPDPQKTAARPGDAARPSKPFLSRALPAPSGSVFVFTRGFHFSHKSSG
jgi:hypothetical protein